MSYFQLPLLGKISRIVSGLILVLMLASCSPLNKKPEILGLKVISDKVSLFSSFDSAREPDFTIEGLVDPKNEIAFFDDTPTGWVGYSNITFWLDILSLASAKTTIEPALDGYPFQKEE